MRKNWDNIKYISKISKKKIASLITNNLYML